MIQERCDEIWLCCRSEVLLAVAKLPRLIIITAPAMILTGLFFLSSLLALVLGLDITGSIASNGHLSTPAILPPSTLLILSSANLEYKTHPSPSGSFTFRNITAG